FIRLLLALSPLQDHGSRGSIPRIGNVKPSGSAKLSTRPGMLASNQFGRTGRSSSSTDAINARELAAARLAPSGQASPVQAVKTAWQRTLRRPTRGLVPLAESRMRWLRTSPALPTGPQHGT